MAAFTSIKLPPENGSKQAAKLVVAPRNPEIGCAESNANHKSIEGSFNAKSVAAEAQRDMKRIPLFPSISWRPCALCPLRFTRPC